MPVPTTVYLSDYDPSWPCRFNSECEVLHHVFGQRAVSIEHIGSTAVEGLPAKPCVDIAVAVQTLAIVPDIVPHMRDEEYEYLGEFGLPGRHFFRKPVDPESDKPPFHVHVVLDHSYNLRAWRIFRDLLREREDLREDYTALKRELAARFANDRASYTAGKGEFIDRVVNAAMHS